MSNVALRFMTVAVVAVALTACGKNEETRTAAAAASAGTQKDVYGKEDAECFAGIIRAADAKHFTPVDLGNWKNKLNSKDKDWLSGFYVAYSKATGVVETHLGRTPEELYKADLITLQQLDMVKGYVDVFQMKDAAKADSLSASACASIGFSKGTDLN